MSKLPFKNAFQVFSPEIEEDILKLTTQNYVNYSNPYGIAFPTNMPMLIKNNSLESTSLITAYLGFRTQAMETLGLDGDFYQQDPLFLNIEHVAIKSILPIFDPSLPYFTRANELVYEPKILAPIFSVQNRHYQATLSKAAEQENLNPRHQQTLTDISNDLHKGIKSCIEVSAIDRAMTEFELNNIGFSHMVAAQARKLSL